MYEEFFGVRENPFNVNPDPRYLFMTRSILEALACLAYGIEKRKGFMLITGEVGTGKTTLLNKLLEWLHREGSWTASIFNPRLTVAEFFDFVLSDFGVTCDSQMKSQVLLKFNDWILERHKAGQRVVLIVDEAQDLSRHTLEEIRLLSNLETTTAKLLQVVLVGQPELEHKLNQPSLRQLRQRITVWAKTEPLTLDETRRYINERLSIAGSKTGDAFTSEAIEAVHGYACGIPRVINLLSEHAMISAFAEGRKPVPSEIVEEAARDFGLHEISPIAEGLQPSPNRKRTPPCAATYIDEAV